jgi:hypothetical protein
VESTVVHGGRCYRRVHHLNDVRSADDCNVTATARRVWEDTLLPLLNAVLAARGLRRSPTKTVIAPSAQGFGYREETLRTQERPHGQPGKLQMTPGHASCRALTARLQALCKRTVGRILI